MLISRTNFSSALLITALCAACSASPPSNAQKSTTVPSQSQSTQPPPEQPPSQDPPEVVSDDLPEITSEVSKRPPFSPPPDTALTKPPQDLLLGRWRGERAYGAPSAESEAADRVARDMRFTFDPQNLSVSFTNAGTHTTPYSTKPTSKRTLSLRSAQTSEIVFHTDTSATIVLQSGARIFLQRETAPAP